MNRTAKILLSIFALVALSMRSQKCEAQTDLYGAGDANKKFLPSKGMLGGRTDFHYLNLENHPGVSGVPLGGIGAGNIEFAPSGRFVRIGLNNIHLPISKSRGSFFTLWYKTKKETKAVRLVKEEQEQYGMKGIEKTYFKGLFPRAELTVGETMPVSATVTAFSGLLPHDVKNSSLPIAFFEVELKAKNEAEVSVALSWEDFIGRGLKEPKAIDGMDGQIFGGRRKGLVNGENWPDRPPVSTFAELYKQANYTGIRQFAARPLIPIKATFQNYVQEMALLAEQQAGATVSVLPAFSINRGESNWEAFQKTGRFDSSSRPVYNLSGGGAYAGSAVAIKAKLKAGETRRFRFMLAWFYPELRIDHDTAPPESYWKGGSDYGRYFHNYFERLDQLVGYGVQYHDFILNGVREWQEPVLTSTMPDWLKFKLINSAYVIYTNMVLNKKGDVMINEGGMGGLAGTMDQRISSHPFYQKFFTQLDRSEMGIFADAQAANGSISHFIGHYYVGMGTIGGRIPTENDWMLDNTEGWIIQLAKDFEQTGDYHYLRNYAGRVKDGMDFLKSKMPAGVEIPVGPTTYDDFKHPPIYSYGAGMYLASLKAAEAIANALQDSAWATQCREQFLRSQTDMIKFLWNGQFFSYGCEVDGSGRLDQILFTGQLAGQFISRYCGWGDILPLEMIRSSLMAQFTTSLSSTPDYYANKVWDLKQGRGIDQEGSQCWPFYLESYTAYPALQAGYVADALDIIRHIQLVHLRKGYTWCQNLWNPAELNYMTAPVSWFATDLLAGSGINIPRKELRLAPIVQGKQKQVLPLFFPTFWAVLSLDPKRKKAVLRVTKTFGSETYSIQKLVIEPVGKPSDDHKEIPIQDFILQQGNELDVSAWWSELTQSAIKPSVLASAAKSNGTP